MAHNQVLHTAPIEPLLSNEQLCGGRVIYQHFLTPEYKDERYTGIVTEVKTSAVFGVQVRIQPDANVFHLAPRWLPLHCIKGWAWFDVADDAPAPESQTTAA